MKIPYILNHESFVRRVLLKLPRTKLLAMLQRHPDCGCAFEVASMTIENVAIQFVLAKKDAKYGRNW